MYFTPRASSRPPGPRWPRTAPPGWRSRGAGGSVLDVGCGIGGDLLALARAGLTVAGIDLDELRVEVARANLAALGLGGAVQVAAAEDVDTSGFGVVFADPARRTARGAGVRRRRLVAAVAVRAVAAGAAVVREGGAGHPARAGARRRGGRVGLRRGRGQGGGAVVPGARHHRPARHRDPGRRAGHGHRRGTRGDRGAPGRARTSTSPTGRWSAPAWWCGGRRGRRRPARRAHRLRHVRRRVRTPFARSYASSRCCRSGRSSSGRRCASGSGRLTIKKRGVDVVPDQLRKRLLQGAPAGGEEATLVLTRVAGRGTALLVRPLR